MNSPIFSVIIPLYNKEQYIKDTIYSVINQTFTNFEIIIIDDGSTDRSLEVVKSIDDLRVILINQTNGGVSKARNRGIREAKGEFIAFLDADDIWASNKLEKQYKIHQKYPELKWSCGGYKIIGDKKKNREVIFKSNLLNLGLIDDAIDAIVEGLRISTITVVIRKEIFNNNRLYFNEDINTSEDREVWYKIASLYPSIGYVPKILAFYKVGIDSSLTANSFKTNSFDFLTVKDRIDKELNSISRDRKEKMINYLDEFNLRTTILIWSRDKSFKDNIPYNLKFYLDKKLIERLNRWSRLPTPIKKVVVKIREIYMRKIVKKNI